MAKTYTEQLDAVQAAIEKIEAGAQSYTGPTGRQLTRADLETLYKREERLMAKVKRESSGGITIRQVTPVL